MFPSVEQSIDPLLNCSHLSSDLAPKRFGRWKACTKVQRRFENRFIFTTSYYSCFLPLLENRWFIQWDKKMVKGQSNVLDQIELMRLRCPMYAFLFTCVVRSMVKNSLLGYTKYLKLPRLNMYQTWLSYLVHLSTMVNKAGQGHSDS